MNANWAKNQSEEIVLKEIAKDFIDKKNNIEFFIKSDDGGRHLEVRILGQHNASELRNKIPLNYKGWRTVVIGTPVDIVVKRKE